MKVTPKISLVTICYNNESDIRKTISSVINQSYGNIEYIVIDGKSNDRTYDIVLEYKEFISSVISEEDENLYDAINKGLRLSTGDVVGLIHAGDELFDDNVIEDIANHFDHYDIDLSYGHSLIVTSDSKPVRVNRSPEYRKSLIRRGWMPSHQSIYMKRSLLDTYGYYDLDIHPSSDYEFFLRYFYFNDLKVKRLNRYILKFSIGGISTRNYVNNLRAQKTHVMCWTANGKRAPFFLVPLKLLRKPIQFARAACYRNV